MQNSITTVVVCIGLVLGCAGGEKPPSESGDTMAAAPASSTATSTATSTTTSTATAPQPVTGKTWQVKMLGDAKGYRFEPATLTIKAGDGVKWTVVSGPPHNVTFWPDSIPAGGSSALQSAMQQTSAPLTGPLLMTANQTYTISFAGAPKGTYHYYCTPHLALGMVGKLTVQ